MNARSLAVCTLLCVAAGAAGASDTAPGLMGLYERAKAQDAHYAMARHTLRATLEKVPQARSALLPNVQLSAAQGRQVGSASFSDAPWLQRSPGTWSWALQLSQPLLRGPGWAGYDQALTQVKQAQAQWTLAEQDLLLRCAQAYFDVQIAQQSASVMEAQWLAVQEQLQVAERTFEVGTGTITDVHEARARQAMTQAQKFAAANEVSLKQAEIERLVGEPIVLAPLTLHDTLPPLDVPLDTWRDLALQYHPQIAAHTLALEMADLEVLKSERAHWPTLDLTASAGTQFSSGSLGSPADLSSRVESRSLGVQLTLPLYAGHATQSKIREAVALQAKAASELVSAQRAVQVQVQQAFWGVVNGQAQMQALAVAVEAGRSAVEGNQIGYRIGTRINPDVLHAQQQLFAAMRDLGKARAETAMQGLRLKASAGLLSADDLQALETLLEPVK